MTKSIRELRTELLVNHFFQKTGYFAIKWEDGQLYAYDSEGDCHEFCGMHRGCEICLVFARLFQHLDDYYRHKDYERVVSVH